MLADGNAVLPDTQVLFVIDPDDESKYDVPTVVVESAGGGMGPPLNAAVAKYWDDFDILGFIGDDHRIRTPGWDQIVAEHMAKDGVEMVYGNDLIRHDIPTNIFMSSRVVKALGWMALPGAKHLYLDNAWAELGGETDTLYYDPKLIIEHMHPTVGKAEYDDGYKRVNATSVYSHDGQVYAGWIRVGQAAKDADTIKSLL